MTALFIATGPLKTFFFKMADARLLLQGREEETLGTRLSSTTGLGTAGAVHFSAYPLTVFIQQLRTAVAVHFNASPLTVFIQ